MPMMRRTPINQRMIPVQRRSPRNGASLDTGEPRDHAHPSAWDDWGTERLVLLLGAIRDLPMAVVIHWTKLLKLQRLVRTMKNQMTAHKFLAPIGRVFDDTVSMKNQPTLIELAEALVLPQGRDKRREDSVEGENLNQWEVKIGLDICLLQFLNMLLCHLFVTCN